MTGASKSSMDAGSRRIFDIVDANGAGVGVICRSAGDDAGDWSGLLRLAVQNGVASYMHAFVGQLSQRDDAAQAMFERLRGRAQRSTYRSLAMRAELVRILRAFEQADIKVLPLKGPYLADRYYATPGLREFGDLDLLVGEADRDRAWQLLLQIGYHSPYENHDLDNRYHIVFRHKESDELVELHWRIAGRQFGRYYRGGFLWAGATQRPYRGGVSVREPRVESTLLYLAIHAYKHDWCRLQWLLDFPEVIRSAPELDWDRLNALALEQHAHRLLRATLQLVRGLFPQAPNAPEGHALARPALSKSQSRRVGALMLGDASDAQKLRNFYALRVAMAETWVDKLRLIVDSLRPSDRDHEFLPLPPLLRPFRFIVRPLRLLGRIVTGRSRDAERRNR